MALKHRLATAVLGMGALLAVKALGRREPYSFQGKSVLITGGSRGLGLVLARLLSDEGARLTLLARDRDELERAAEELRSRGAEVLALPCDVRSQEEVQGAVATALTHYGRIDVLINNAGVIAVGPIEHMQIADFEEALAVHLWGPLYTMLATVPRMRVQGGGRIINISSIGGLVAVPHLVPYSASKFALVGLSDGMRDELAKDGIVVTTVCPGLMRTGSHVNALFKGQHTKEFAWFAIGDANPLLSMEAERAGRQIIAAARRGAARATISIQAQALAAVNALLPGVMSKVMQINSWVLPGPTGAEGNEPASGWASQSFIAPSFLTRPADRASDQNNELRGHKPLAE